jgi:hypothetical protein
MAFEVAGLFEAQPMFEVRTQVITSPLLSDASVYVVDEVPTLIPFFFHWYVGEEPPFVGTAVNVTLVPAQIEPTGFAEIATLTVNPLFTTTASVWDGPVPH